MIRGASVARLKSRFYTFRSFESFADHLSGPVDPAGEKLGQERRENGAPWRSKNRPPEIYLRKRSKQERFVGYRRDVYSGAICTSSASGSGRGEKRTAGGPGVWAGA